METVRLLQDGQLEDLHGGSVADALTALPGFLVLEPDCSLRSFLLMLERYPVLQKLSGFLPAAVADMKACPLSGCNSADMSCLVLGKTMELIGFPGDVRAETYMWLRGLSGELPTEAAHPGVGGPSKVQGRAPLGLLMGADREIRFIPLQLLLDMPLYLGGLKHVVLGDVNRHLYCESGFSLFEVVDGLAWELGFQGGSQQCSIGR